MKSRALHILKSWSFLNTSSTETPKDGGRYLVKIKYYLIPKLSSLHKENASLNKASIEHSSFPNKTFFTT